jgi:hypothetical protein
MFNLIKSAFRLYVLMYLLKTAIRAIYVVTHEIYRLLRGTFDKNYTYR